MFSTAIFLLHRCATAPKCGELWPDKKKIIETKVVTSDKSGSDSFDSNTARGGMGRTQLAQSEISDA